MKTVKIQHPTIGSFYQVTMSERELLALTSVMRVLKVGFINWLARKGKRTQETQYFYVREAEELIDQLEAPIVEERRQREADAVERKRAHADYCEACDEVHAEPCESQVDAMVDAAEREFVRANDLPTEPRAEND